MKKSTLKKGGIVLLGALGVAGFSFANMLPQVASTRAPWYDTREHFKTPSIGATQLKPIEKVNIHTHAAIEGAEYGNYYSVIDFANMKDAKLMAGVYASFLNMEETEQLPFDGQHLTMAYDEIKNHEKMNTASTFTFVDETEKACLGIYQNTKAKARVDFTYSTKGLIGVEGIDIDMAAYGNKELVNRSIDWSYNVYIYDLAGKYLSNPVQEKPIFTAENHQIGAKHAWRNILQISDGGVLKQGDLDNKIIVIMFESTQSVPDKTLESTVDKTKDTEPLTVFRNARIAFNRPDVEIEGETTVFEAGAGRNTSCNKATFTTTVEFWNTLYEKGEANNKYTATFEDVEGRDGLVDADKEIQQELAYYELHVKYPFIVDNMTASNSEDFTKVGDAISLDDFIVKGTPGVSDEVIYRIPREYFVQKDGVDDRDRISNATFDFYFAPQEVAEFKADSYIWATTTAEASDTARFVLSGSSIPTYNEVNDLNFDEYKDYKTAEISFKNLPYFNSRGEKDLDEIHWGEITLANRTKAYELATDRYDDDVNLVGWKIVYKNAQTVNGLDSTYVPGRYLPMKVNGHSYKDYVEWFNQFCATCQVPDAPVIGSHTDNMPVIDCAGNIEENIVSINAIFRYSRGDVNVDDDESLYVREKYTIAPALTYKTATSRYDKNSKTLETNAKYTYSAQDLMDGKAGAVYEGPIWISGTNTFVWYNFESDDLLSHAMGIVTPVLANVKDKDRLDLFFSPYDETSTVRFESRPHTVYIKATGLKPDVAGGTTATIKVFKEQFSKNESTDDALYHTNAFLFTAGEKEYDKAYWLSNNISNPVKTMAKDVNGVYGKLKGTAVTDTLYFEVDLDDVALVNRIKNEGLEMKVVYMPFNDRNDKAIIWDLIQGCCPGLPNVFDHIAQFGIKTADVKGFNEFYTVGTTDAGLVTTMNADVREGSYNSFYPFILNQFSPVEHGATIKGIYREAFTKDYQTRYVNTCYPEYTGQFIIAGINVMDPVDMTTFSNKSTAYKYSFVELADLNGVVYSTIDSVNGKVQINPNKYGEVLIAVNVAFDPVDRDGIAMSIDTINTGSAKGMWARYYAKDTIQLAPQQRSNEIANRVRFYDLNDYERTLKFDDKKWLDLGFFAPYGININDTLTAKIKGDVKVPEVWYSSDAEGKKKIENFQFGVVNAGEMKDSVIYIQGRDLPHYGTSTIESENKIEQKINLISNSDMFTFGTAKTKELNVREQSLALAMNGNMEDGSLNYVFKGGKDDLVKNVMRGDVVAKIDLRATPNVEDLCDVENVISLAAVCDVNKDLGVAFTAGLANPTIKEPTYGEIGGSDAKFNWKAVPGAEYYKVAVGRFTPKFTSEDVFISEVRADKESRTIWVELFNATGSVIHRDNQVNYWLEVTKEYKEDGVVKKETSIVGVDNFSIQGNLDPIDRKWSYAPIAHQMNDMDLTTDVTNPIKYTIRLMEGFQTDKHQIDIYLFDTPETWMVRKPVSPMPINNGEFYTGDWRTEVGSLPTAYYEWQDDINFDGEESFDIASTSTSIQVHNLIPQTAYTVRVQAYNKCVGDANQMIPSEDYLDFATSKTATSTGDIYFDNADPSNPVGNESIDATAITAIGGKGQVTILNAGGKKAVVANVLGQVIANTVISSDNATFPASAGMVVVTLEDGTVLKAMVK